MEQRALNDEGTFASIKATHDLKVISNIKKAKIYEFPELTKEDVEEGRLRTHDNPYFVKRKEFVFELYVGMSGKLKIVLHHSYDRFEVVDVAGVGQKTLEVGQ